jgi:hypothetical protein
LEWLGLVIKMDQIRVVAMDILQSKPEGRRIMGRSRLRWLVGAGNDSQELKVKRQRQITNNKEEWASVVREAKVFRGPRVVE